MSSPSPELEFARSLARKAREDLDAPMVLHERGGIELTDLVIADRTGSGATDGGQSDGHSSTGESQMTWTLVLVGEKLALGVGD